MNTPVLYDESSKSFKYFNRPVVITENDTCYMFTDKESGTLVYYIDYENLFNLASLKNIEIYKDIFRMALLSEGLQNVPTCFLVPSNTNAIVHDKISSTLTSLKKLSFWLKFISNNVYGTYELGSRLFKPFEPLQIGKIFESINVTNFTPESKKCFDDSVELFDFENNLSKISWFNEALSQFKLRLPNIESEEGMYNNISPSDAFLLANEIMMHVFVYEAANHPIEQIIASNIIYIHFLQDTGSSTNVFRPLLPIMQAALVYTSMPAIVPSTMSTYLKSKVKILTEKAKFNKNNNRKGWYKLYMKLKHVNAFCNKNDCLDVLQYLLFEYNVFDEECEDVIIAFLRTVLKANNKAELYVYIIQFGFCLACLRITKPQKSIAADSETVNLSNFKFTNKEVKRMTAQNRQILYNELKEDVSSIFNFINPYVTFMLDLEKSNPTTFNSKRINEDSFVYFMKTNNTFSEFINYILKTILPLITSHLT